MSRPPMAEPRRAGFMLHDEHVSQTSIDPRGSGSAPALHPMGAAILRDLLRRACSRGRRPAGLFDRFLKRQQGESAIAGMPKTEKYRNEFKGLICRARLMVA